MWWRSTPPVEGSARAYFTPVEGGAEVVQDLELETRGEASLVRSATIALRGRLEVRLEIDGREIWRGSANGLPGQEEIPELVRIGWLEDLDPEEVPRVFERLRQDEDPWRRYLGHRTWARRLRGQDATRASEAYARAGVDPGLRSTAPQLAEGLLLAAASLDANAGRFDRAEDSLQSLEARQAGLTPRQRAILYYNQGLVAAGRLRFSRGIEYFQDSMGVAWDRGEDPTWAYGANSLAGQLGRLGRYSEAFELLRQARSRFERADQLWLNELNTLWALQQAEEAGSRAVNLDEIAARYEDLLQDEAAKGRADDRLYIVGNLTYIALRQEDLSAAVRWASWVDEFGEATSTSERWFIRTVRAEVFLRQGRLQDADHALRRVIEGVRREVGGVGPQEVVARRLLSEVHAARGDDAGAAEALEQAWRQSLEASRRLELVGARNHYLHTQRRLPVELSRRRAAAGDLLGAAAVFEETLFERWAQLAALAALAQRPAAWVDIEAARAKLRAVLEAPCITFDVVGDTGEYASCLKARSDAREAVRLALMHFYASLELAPRDDVRGELEAARAELGEGQGILLALGDAQDTQAFLLTRAGVVSASGHVEASLEERALAPDAVPLGTATQPAVDRAGPPGRRLGSGRLDRAAAAEDRARGRAATPANAGAPKPRSAAPGLLASLAPALAKLSSVTVVGTLDLAAALSPDGRPWGARLRIRRRPGVVLPPPAVRGFGDDVRVFADPRGDLPRARKGTVALAARWPTTPALGPAATREALRDGFAAHPAVLVYSGHAEELELDHSSTRLLLFDGELDMQDILSRKLAAKLVVLNGCSTGGTSRGYGVGLPESLLLEGSRAVLATIEPVADVESTRFLERFFDAGGAEDPAGAYQRAVVASIAAEDDVWRRYRLWAR